MRECVLGDVGGRRQPGVCLQINVCEKKSAAPLKCAGEHKSMKTCVHKQVLCKHAFIIMSVLYMFAHCYSNL